MVTQDNVEKAAEFLASVTNNTSSVDENSVASVADLVNNIVSIQDTSPEVSLVGYVYKMCFKND